VVWRLNQGTFTIKPINAAPPISHAELRRKRNRAIALATKIRAVSQSAIAALPSCQATTAIRAKDPTTTPSNIAPAIGSAEALE
jgi:hypothetical protein